MRPSALGENMTPGNILHDARHFGHRCFVEADVGFRTLLVLTLVMAALALALWLRQPEPFEPLEYVVPESVLTPIVQYEGDVIVVAERCNHLDRPLDAEGYVYFRNVVTQEVVQERQASRQFEPGCQTTVFTVNLPGDITPGVWRLEGKVTAKEGSQEQLALWWSEPFEVVDVESN